MYVSSVVCVKFFRVFFTAVCILGCVLVGVMVELRVFSLCRTSSLKARV